MDPVTAVALAGNLLQFVQFVVGLFDDARKLHASATGTSSNNNHIQDVCGMLINFDGQFQQSQSSLPTNITRSKHAKQIAEFATDCKHDCEVLLQKMNKLKVIGAKGPRYWRSFQAALSEVWQSSEIEEYRRRIADRQGAMILLLCAASNESIVGLEDRVQDLGRGIWTLHSDSRMDFMMEEIKKLGNYIKCQDRKTATSEDVDKICSKVSKMSLETQVFEREARVLAKLNYTDRPVRHEKIPDAHFKTFKWSLEETEQTKAIYGKLRRWLRGDDALFWVSGKPGSGKSTLMKHIADSEDTKKCLKAWAGARDLLVVSHYFTIYGTPIQRSLEGLLRSLVFGALAGKPALIPKLIPDHWETSPVGPRQSELETLLRLLGPHLDELSCKIIFFIDGLDEFEGDHMDVCEMLKESSRSPFVKVCVSSRPWNVFEDALGEKPDSKLYMHELTHDDILDYTAYRLQAHPRWKFLLGEFTSVSSVSLIKEVASKSNGVFLWVTLVVRLLREGLTNDDSLSDLQRRLTSFPADLKDFFGYIIKSVDPFYNEKMAGTLSIALEAQEPLSIEIFSLHDLGYDDENYAFKAVKDTELIPTNSDALEKVFCSVSRRINGRCKGLLERNGGRMEFLHRTVYDFLRTGEMDDFLREHTKNRHCPSLSLFKAFVAWIKRSQFATEWDDISFENHGFLTTLVQGLRYARLAEMQGESSAALTAALLDNLEKSLAQMFSRGQIRMPDTSYAIGVFRHLILEAGIAGYIRSKLSAGSKYFATTYATQIEFPLTSVLGPSCKFTTTDQMWILTKLLKSGHDPNHVSDDQIEIRGSLSPWKVLFEAVDHETTTYQAQGWQRNNDLLAIAEKRIILVLLENGADATATVFARIGTASLEMPIWLMFLHTLRCAQLPKQPAVIEETLHALIDGFETLENPTVARGDDPWQESANFWDVCESWWEFSLPTTTGSCGDGFMTRIFACVLAKIPAEHQSFAKAEVWCKAVLSASAANALESAIAFRRSENHLRLSEKREVAEEPGISRDAKRIRRT